jgi:uncharacterized membrane protein YbhN (UPF0104 family)
MSPRRKRLVLALKTALALALILGVGWRFADLLSKPELRERQLTPRVEYLLPAGLLYLAAHTIWATFFVQLLRSQGARVPWRTGVRAYFVSQFGKYVPGKAWVILLRMMILRRHGLSAAVVGVSATYEALTSMAAGAVIGVCLLPWAGMGLEVGSVAWLGLIAVAGLPLALGALNKVAARVVAKRRGPDARPLPSPPVWLLGRGLLQAAAGWCLLGLSLCATIRGLTPEPTTLTGDNYLASLAAVAVSYVAGFVVLISPGGLGARELLLQEMLARQLGPSAGLAAEGLAAVVALVLRLVWTASEVGVALMLLAIGKLLGHDGERHG